jgi:eukaryotic-like serine/threonine-protein kinase
MPQRFGRFWLHERIGTGGMAEIFRATVGADPNARPFDVALKRLLPGLRGDKAQVDMFLTEADVGKFLRHPNLVQVYESGIIDENPFIAMEYVWGIDLARLSVMLRHRGWRFPSDLAVYIAMQVLRGLDYIHRARAPGGEAMEMVHRDVNPANLYMTFDGQVKLGDFGIARVSFLEPRDETRSVKGKAFYIPPEVLRGESPTQGDDLWALAVTLYEMLAGERVYPDTTEDDIIEGNANVKIAPLHKVNPEIDRKLSDILARALSPKPKKRQQTAADFYKELKNFLRTQGIVVGAQALAKFVISATGAKPQGQQPHMPGAGFFEGGGYTAPVGLSLTQRFEVIRRRRMRLAPVLILGSGLLIGAAILWFGRLRG